MIKTRNVAVSRLNMLLKFINIDQKFIIKNILKLSIFCEPQHPTNDIYKLDNQSS